MAETTQRNNQEGAPPGEMAAVTPDVSGGSGQTRLVIQAIEPTITEIRNEMRDLRNSAQTDFRLVMAAFGAGFLLLGGMLIAGYFRLDDRISKLEERVTTMSNQTSNQLTRIDTKLDDLIQRIPPVQTPIPAQRR